MKTLNDYISLTLLPFCSSIDENVKWKTADFQSILSSYIDLHYGELKLGSRFQTAEKVKNACENIYAVNAYKYGKLFDTLEFEYNPIDNYDMTEVEETQKDVDNSNTFTKGGQSDTVGAVTDTHKVSPYDTANLTAESSDEKTQQTNTLGQRIDTSVDNDSDHTERELHRHGNIGVMSTQQLIESERKIADFTIYKIVAKDIIKLITVTVYGGDE